MARGRESHLVGAWVLLRRYGEAQPQSVHFWGLRGLSSVNCPLPIAAGAIASHSEHV